ncbi:rCG36464, partial [Rattus norvegicus]
SLETLYTQESLSSGSAGAAVPLRAPAFGRAALKDYKTSGVKSPEIQEKPCPTRTPPPGTSTYCSGSVGTIHPQQPEVPAPLPASCQGRGTRRALDSGSLCSNLHRFYFRTGTSLG